MGQFRQICGGILPLASLNNIAGLRERGTQPLRRVVRCASPGVVEVQVRQDDPVDVGGPEAGLTQVLEQNVALLRPISRMGARETKRYRLFRKSFAR